MRNRVEVDAVMALIATGVNDGHVRYAPRYTFSNRSEEIKAIFCAACDALGIRWTRPSFKHIAIYPRASVARMDQFVGPKR